MSRTSCSVGGCHNYYRNCPPETHFYTFPSDKLLNNRFPGRRKLWINAVRRSRIKFYGLTERFWMPSKASKVCSQHFSGGVKREHPYHVDYVPSIFPNNDNLESNVKLFSSMKKGCNFQDGFTSASYHTPDFKSVAVNCCLTDNDIESNYPEIPIMFSSIAIAGSSTQTYIPKKVKTIKTEIPDSSQTDVCMRTQTSQDCFSQEKIEEDNDIKGFLRIESVKTEENSWDTYYDVPTLQDYSHKRNL